MPVRKTKSVKKSTKSAVAGKKKFSLSDFKKEQGLTNVKFKEQEWIPLSPAFQETTGLIGIPQGHLTVLRGHTDTGKTTTLLEAAVAAQKMGILPVFIITELKFSWDHARLMGLEFTEVVDEDGVVVDYEGDFIYMDRASLPSIESTGEFMLNLMDLQKKGDLDMPLLFLYDSIGSIPCELSIKSNKSNNEWDAGAISRVFGKSVIPQINLSRKENVEHTNTFVCITQVWTRKPDSPVGLPKLACKGGDTIPFNASLMITFGNVTNSGTSKLKVKKNGKDLTYATRTKITIEKNHINGISTSGRIIATPHFFVMDSDKDTVAKKYFKDHEDFFTSQLGAGDGEIVFFEEEDNEVIEAKSQEEIND